MIVCVTLIVSKQIFTRLVGGTENISYYNRFQKQGLIIIIIFLRDAKQACRVFSKLSRKTEKKKILLQAQQKFSGFNYNLAPDAPKREQK